MHPEEESKAPGSCPKCGMALVLNNEILTNNNSWFGTYKPLIVITGMILLVTIAIGLRDYANNALAWQNLMTTFMAGFFLVFSGFKLLDVKGFADGYITYDILAGIWRPYAYVYPFIELGLGLSFAAGFYPEATKWIALIIMTFSGLGVVRSKLQKRQFQCACLGTIFKLPLTTVTLIEDFGMAAMAATMLLI